MAHWAEHVMLSGWRGVLPDVPLVIGIVLNKGMYIDRDSIWYRLHTLAHSPWVVFFYACYTVGHGQMFRCNMGKGKKRSSKRRYRFFAKAQVEHIVLDYLTHEKAWLKHGRGNYVWSVHVRRNNR